MTHPTRIAYLGALLQANWKTHLLGFKRTAFLSVMMLLQNLMFFALWIIFFGSVGQIKGWVLKDVALLYGSIAFSVGLAMFFCDGARTIALRIQDGSLESLLTQPRHPLPSLLLSRSNAASLGDLLSGPVYWFCFGGLSITQLPALIGLSLLAAVIFLAATLMFFSLAFWLRRSGRFSEQLFEILVIISALPQHGQPFGVQLIMFSVLPAGFISLTPVSLMRHFEAGQLAALIAAAIVYVGLSVIVFHVGLKRYRRAPTA
ncbi:MAG: hypothetical protein HGA90_01245 [Alphaproteobacteria bacterium]|nr:hypothetical protein [Alphaproteobacteria bacterium]